MRAKKGGCVAEARLERVPPEAWRGRGGAAWSWPRARGRLGCEARECQGLGAGAVLVRRVSMDMCVHDEVSEDRRVKMLFPLCRPEETLCNRNQLGYPTLHPLSQICNTPK